MYNVNKHTANTGHMWSQTYTHGMMNVKQQMHGTLKCVCMCVFIKYTNILTNSYIVHNRVPCIAKHTVSGIHMGEKKFQSQFRIRFDSTRFFPINYIFLVSWRRTEKSDRHYYYHCYFLYLSLFVCVSLQHHYKYIVDIITSWYRCLRAKKHTHGMCTVHCCVVSAFLDLKA